MTGAELTPLELMASPTCALPAPQTLPLPTTAETVYNRVPTNAASTAFAQSLSASVGQRKGTCEAVAGLATLHNVYSLT